MGRPRFGKVGVRRWEEVSASVSPPRPPWRIPRAKQLRNAEGRSVSDAHPALRPASPSTALASGFRAVSRPSEGLATAVRRRMRAGDRPRWSPARSAVGVRGVGASATPTPLCDQPRRPPRLHPVSQRCRGLPKALPPQSEGAARGRQAAVVPRAKRRRSAGGRSVSDAHPALRQASPSTALASGFRAVSRPSEGLATAVRRRRARETGRVVSPREAPSECGG